MIRNVLLATTLVAASISASLAHAQYTASVFPVPAGSTQAYAYGGSHGQEAGSVVQGRAQAVYWNGLTGSQVNLNLWGYGSQANAAANGYQGGEGYVYSVTLHGSGRGATSHTYYIPHAMLWHGSAGSAVDLNPSIAYESAVLGMGSNQQVGWYSPTLFGFSYATLWHGTSTSATYLNPTGWLWSVAAGVSGPYQVGYGEVPYSVHAVYWKGSAASAVDIHPTNFLAQASYGYAMDSSTGQEVGAVDVGTAGVSLMHACLWHGKASSAIDLNPSGFTSSTALSCGGGYQVGSGLNASARTHALVWKGSPQSAVDLHTFLPANMVSSAATGRDFDESITGYASDGTYTYPVVWRPNGVNYVSATQSVSPNASGWATSSVSLNLSSPFTAPATSISYSINGGTTATAPGSSLNLPFASTGTYTVLASSSDGGTHLTQSLVYSVNVDLDAPVTTSSYDGANLTLKATDKGSGVAVTYFTLDGGSPLVYHGSTALTNTGHTITYWSLDHAGNVEATHTATFNAVAPTLSSLDPATVLTSSGTTTLTLNGTGFIASSTVSWNGTNRAVTYVSPNVLQIAVTASDLATPGTAQITVSNPSPGVGTSKPLTFTVLQSASAAGDMVNQNAPYFDINPVSNTSGFSFSGQTIHVVTTSTTNFYETVGGYVTAAVFFESVEDSAPVSVVGTFDPATQTLTAWTVVLNNN